jgi:hypothetical protein
VGDEDADGDGVPDAKDNCPGDDAQLGLANPGQTDTDGDGIGDLCDPCPLSSSADGAHVCQPITDSSMRVGDRGESGNVVWRGYVELPDDTDASSLRLVLVAGSGVLVDTASPATTRTLRRRGRLRSRMLFRSDVATIAVKRGRGGLYGVRAVMRGMPLGADAMPVVSASLQMGTSVFSASLSCPPRGGRRFNCRG